MLDLHRHSSFGKHLKQMGMNLVLDPLDDGTGATEAYNI